MSNYLPVIDPEIAHLRPPLRWLPCGSLTPSSQATPWLPASFPARVSGQISCRVRRPAVCSVHALILYSLCQQHSERRRWGVDGGGRRRRGRKANKACTVPNDPPFSEHSRSLMLKRKGITRFPHAFCLQGFAQFSQFVHGSFSVLISFSSDEFKKMNNAFLFLHFFFI